MATRPVTQHIAEGVLGARAKPLTEFATALGGLGRTLLAAEALARADSNEFPAREIGELGEPDYKRREPGRYVRVRDRRVVDCTNTVLLEWTKSVTLPPPVDCNRITGEEVQSVLNAEIEAAETAAARLCTDSDCKFAHTTLVFQFWICGILRYEDTHEEWLRLSVHLQLELQCRSYA